MLAWGQGVFFKTFLKTKDKVFGKDYFVYNAEKALLDNYILRLNSSRFQWQYKRT